MQKSIWISHRMRDVVLLIPLTLGANLAYSQSEQRPRVVEEIVVTAEKREASLQRTPISIAAFSETDVMDKGLATLGDLQAHTPSLVFGSTGGVTHVTMRGVGQNLTIGTAETGVALYVDGVYMGHSSLSGSTFKDLQRIEALRGPQGILYGRNATGGAVNMISRSPGEHFNVDLEFTQGSDKLTEFFGAVEGRLTDNVRGRLAASVESRDGWRKNRWTGEDMEEKDSKSIRGTLVTDVSDTLSLTWRADWSDEEIKNGPAYSFIGVDTEPSSFDVSPLQPGGIFQSLLNTPGVPAETLDFDGKSFYSDFDSGLQRKTHGASLTADWQPAGKSWEVKSILAWREAELDRAMDIDGTPIDLVHERHARDETEQFSWEINVSGTIGDSLDWIGGLYYYDQTYDRLYVSSFPQLARAVQTAQEIEMGLSLGDLDGMVPSAYLGEGVFDTKSTAAYGQVSYQMTERLSATAGLRYTVDKKDSIQTGSLLGSAQCTALEVDDDWSSVTWKVGTEYQASSDVMLYGSVSTGFKAGGMNLCDAATYDPEEILSYEVGAKMAFLDNTAQLNIALFHYDYSDLQNIVISEASIITNASDSTVQGAELELVWLPTDRLEVSGGLSILDTEFDDFNSIDPLNTNLGPLDLAGNKLPRAPDWTGNLTLSYEQPLPTGAVTFSYDVSYSDGYYHDVYNSRLGRQDSFTIQNLRATWRGDSRWEAGVYGKNITNEIYTQNVIALSPAGGFSAEFSDPRQIGVFVRYSLN